MLLNLSNNWTIEINKKDDEKHSLYHETRLLLQHLPCACAVSTRRKKTLPLQRKCQQTKTVCRYTSCHPHYAQRLSMHTVGSVRRTWV